jgi:predicted TIM-barrel fold metal-dependent hydrolase
MTGPWDTRADLTRYSRRARRAGIDASVYFAAFHSDYARANALVAEIVREQGARALGFAFVHAERDRGRVHSMLETAVRDYRFAGIKVHRHDAALTREICDAAAQHALPVLYDVAGEVSQVELFALEYPGVNFIIPHLGSFADDWRAQLGLIDQLVRHDNVFTDSAGVRRFDLLTEAVRRAGAHKLLFGSDGPWLHPGVELAKIRALRLTAVDEALVLGGNLLRLLGRRAARLSAQPARGASAMPDR